VQLVKRKKLSLARVVRNYLEGGLSRAVEACYDDPKKPSPGKGKHSPISGLSKRKKGKKTLFLKKWICKKK